jgi:iron complex outermembrane receptor protein
LLLQQARAQSKTVSGSVTDDKGAAVAGASVLGKGTKAGTATDAAGAFKLTVPAGTNTLVISSIGFASQEVDISKTTTVQVSLVPTNSNLSDVVVVGYGTQRRKDVTGAIASVSAKDFNQGVVTDPLQQIQGKIPGLAITQIGGDPNGALIIRLRGQASITGSQTPLIVVDGVPLSDPTQFSNIPPGDIESYDVLKDASAAAVYGSRGANGVIIVNTKKATSGQVKVEYSGLVSMDKVAKYFPLLSASQWQTDSYNYLLTAKDGSTGVNYTPQGADSLTQPGIPGSYNAGGTTDWQKAITRTAYTDKHNLGFSGGSQHFNFYGSVNYLDQQGVVIDNGKEGYGINLRVEDKAFNDKLDIQAAVNTSQYNRKLIDYTNLAYVLSNLPTTPVYNSANANGYNQFVDFDKANPVEHLNEETNTDKEYLTILKASIDYTLIKGLKIGTLGSLSHFNQQYQWYQPAFALEGNYDNAHQQQVNTDQKTADLHINYNKSFGKHNLGLTGVYEYNYFEDDNFYAGGQQYLVDAEGANNLGGGNSAFNGISSYKEEYSLKSYVGRVAYNYNSTYFITATMRRDGSSKFGVNNRWGNFPSASASWRLTEEKFLKGVTWLQNLEVRAGYGITGNADAISPYSALFLLGQGNRYFDASSSNFSYPFSYSPSQNPNDNLRWEERHGANAGFNFTVLNGRLTGDFNVFSDKTTNLLYNYTVPVPPFYLGSILANVGSLTNKGEELGITAIIVKQRDITWTLSGQIAFVKTKIVSLSGNYSNSTGEHFDLSTNNIAGGYAEGRGLSSNPITFLKVGYSPYTFYLPHYMGVDKSGNQLFSDGKGGTTSYSNAPNFNIDPTPKFNYGISNTISYKQLSLNFFLRGVVGQKIYNNTALNRDFLPLLPGSNVFTNALNNGIRDATTASDLYLEKAGFLRLDNANIGYNFKNIQGVSNLRLYVAANNLFCITKYTGLDPEVRNAPYTPKGGATINEAYIDATYGGDAYYYRTRSFAVGVNVSFK